MECNKDEAVRAKEIAEKKFMERDYAGAKKFASKAHSLYPKLEGLSQMLLAFDVYVSAENRLSSGEVDWYHVLGVNCWANDETVRKRYLKLALMLHPDKNKSLGADGAFKLVSEAWGLLSDQKRRLAYDQKLNPAGMQQRASTQTEVPYAKPSTNGFHNHNSTATSHSRTHKKNVQSRPTSVPSHANGFNNHNSTAASNTRTRNKNMQSKPTSVPSPPSRKPDTFWTICNRCMIPYKYLRVYLNHKLRCPNCHQSFLAVEKDPPSNVMKSSQNSRHHAGGKVASTSMSGHPERVIQNTHDLVNRANDKLKRAQDKLKRNQDAQAATEWEKRCASKRKDSSACREDQLYKRRRL